MRSSGGGSQAETSGGFLGASRELPAVARASQAVEADLQQQRGNLRSSVAHAMASSWQAASEQHTMGFNPCPEGARSSRDAAPAALGPSSVTTFKTTPAAPGSAGAQEAQNAQPSKQVEDGSPPAEAGTEVPCPPSGAVAPSDASPSPSIAVSEPLLDLSCRQEPPSDGPQSVERLAVQAIEAADAALVSQQGSRAWAAGAWDLAATPPVVSGGRWKPAGSSGRRTASQKSTPLLQLSPSGIIKTVSGGDRNRGARLFPSESDFRVCNSWSACLGRVTPMGWKQAALVPCSVAFRAQLL